MSEADQQAATTRLREKIDSEVVDRSANTLLHKMVEAVNHTYRTNVYMENRYALSLRLDPAIMQSDNHEASPYGVVFAHGRRFNGYHVRFRDISRGGMRIVTPASPEQLALESGRHYDECYGLSFAQQMKNKDIPEGGSKCVALVDTVGMSQQNKNFVMRKSVKAFSDSMLDLIVDTPETQSDVLDYYGKPEVLYLGPDEQVSACIIVLFLFYIITVLTRERQSYRLITGHPRGHRLDRPARRQARIPQPLRLHELQAQGGDQPQGGESA